MFRGVSSGLQGCSPEANDLCTGHARRSLQNERDDSRVRKAHPPPPPEKGSRDPLSPLSLRPPCEMYMMSMATIASSARAMEKMSARPKQTRSVAVKMRHARRLAYSALSPVLLLSTAARAAAGRM